MPDSSVRRIVEPSGPPKPAEPITAESLLKEMHELIDMLPDNMLEKAAHYILRVPDFPEDFEPAEIERLTLAKQKFDKGELTQTDDSEAAAWPTGETQAPSHPIRDNLHRLAEYMSGEILDEAVNVLGSTALLGIPVEAAEDEIRILRETEEEFERGEFFRWEDIKRTDV